MGLIALIVLIVILFSGCATSAPRIVIEPATQDLGEVPQEPLETSYTIRNQGDGVLEIEKVSTSCGCTKASVDSETIPPGKTTQLRVTLDPIEDNLHGDVMRIIYVRSNDPDTPEAEVEFRATIRKAES
ncbi:hypothetical protein BMS3Abin02_00800 [bacterium BMS3Abin02]|nr:hypothetical protein BMS3Abin02_00800 [bacterium BMS3Abin02]GBE23305.1 hypothetical protein BMS3Bbin01_02689 [bacterium BMS3Bbin01]HDH26209.1 DUF1573 domain-containing protein [Actinomycetota bacterium]HDK44713.1 DUF1573 domain-containing protein [Actinomycetota bacterium]HDL48701.1 DUF1573 domain-containing protein [Actinomycetota bacterium]